LQGLNINVQIEGTFLFIDLAPKYIRGVTGALTDKLKSVMSFKNLFIPAYLLALKEGEGQSNTTVVMLNI